MRTNSLIHPTSRLIGAVLAASFYLQDQITPAFLIWHIQRKSSITLSRIYWL